MFGLAYCEYDERRYILECGQCGPIGLEAIGSRYTWKNLNSMHWKHPHTHWMNGIGTSMAVNWNARTTKAKEYFNVHLNSVKPGVIVFPKKDQENDILPVLNLKQKVDRKTKQVECMVDYEKTHININVKERSRPTVLRVWRKGLRFC